MLLCERPPNSCRPPSGRGTNKVPSGDPGRVVQSTGVADGRIVIGPTITGAERTVSRNSVRAPAQVGGDRTTRSGKKVHGFRILHDAEPLACCLQVARVQYPRGSAGVAKCGPG